MKKKLIQHKATTLLELIVAISLISVIVIGLFSINMVLSGNSKDYGQRYLLTSETQAALTHILNNATLAVGSGTSDSYGNLDLGIMIGTGNSMTGDPGVPLTGSSPLTKDPNSFCIHQGANNNILNSNNDIWLCYTWSPSSYEINYCTMPFVPATGANSYRGATSCTTNNSTYLGNSFTLPAATFSTAAGGSMAFKVTIQNCINDNASPQTCSSSGTSLDPVNNPEIVKTGTVYPMQEGMQQS